MAIRSIRHAMLLVTALLSSFAVAEAQQQSEDPITASVNTTKAEVRFTDLLAQAPSVKQAGFSLMPVSRNVGTTGSAITITPMAAPNLQVVGGGTLGRLTKWTGFTNSNSVIGNSSIFEDKFGMVGIGTDTPTSKLTVLGLIESTGTGGGVKFPDGTIQTTAGVAPNQVVNSLNGLSAQVMLAAGSNITITPSGNTLTISSSTQDPALSAFQTELEIDYDAGEITGSDSFDVPDNKRLVIQNLTMRATTGNGGSFGVCTLTTRVNGETVSHQIIPILIASGSGGADLFGFQNQVRLYADGGISGNVFFQASRGGSQISGNIKITLSGYLVDLP